MNNNYIDSISLKEQIEIGLHKILRINGRKLKDIASTDFRADIIKQGDKVLLNGFPVIADKKQIFTFKMPILKNPISSPFLIDNKEWVMAQTKDITKCIAKTLQKEIKVNAELTKIDTRLCFVMKIVEEKNFLLSNEKNMLIVQFVIIYGIK